MERIKIKDIASWCNGELSGFGDTEISGITKDSRDTREGWLYIALKGERFDGNDFTLSALEKCSGALGSADISTHKPYIKVKDEKRALLDIAKGYRSLFDIPSVAITGSVGKTTTKEIISSVLSEKYNCLKTEGNLNNEIGMPLMALKMEKSHRIAVFEMGMSGFGEISNMTAVAKPDAAVISNIGMSHIGKLGSQENIRRAKLEILEGLKEDGVLFVCGDDKLLKDYNYPCKTVFYGLGENNDVRGINVAEKNLGCEFDVAMDGELKHICVNIPGKHNVLNALCAIAVGQHFGVDAEGIVRGISKAESVGNRMKISDAGGIGLIADCYNASPDSMRGAIDVLKKQEGRKIAILADMLEMGEFSEDAHINVGEYASDLNMVLTYGKYGEFISQGAKNSGCKEVYHFTEKADLCSFLKENLKEGDVCLVKGSFGMKMIEICEFIEVNFK